MSPWVYLGVVLVWLASLTGVGFWQNHAGHTAERVMWQERYNKEVTDAANQLKAAEEKSRDTEQAWSKKVNAVSADYERKLKNANDKFKSTYVGINNGSVRLFDLHGSAPVCPGPDSTPEASGTPSGRDGAEGCRLSPEASRFLWQLATDADTNAEQLAACQQVILKERE